MHYMFVFRAGMNQNEGITMKRALELFTAVLCMSCAVAYSAVNVLDNGAIKVEISGDGVIGALVYYPYNNTLDHLSDYGIRIRAGGVVRETVEFTQTERNYTVMKMFTGYGREYSSNLYICSASYLTGIESYLDQTLLVLSRRTLNDIAFAQYIDSSVLQTETNDWGEYTPANKLLSFKEAEEACFIGTVSRSVANQETLRHTIAPPDYVQSVLGTASPNMVSNNPENIAGAAWWDPVNIASQPQVFYNRLIGASSLSALQPLGNILDESQRRVKTPGIVVLKKAKFRQRFPAKNRDWLIVKGYVDMAPYASDFTSLSDLTISVFLADFLAFLPTDTAITIAPNGRKSKDRKEDPVLGKEVLVLKLKKNHRLYFTLKITKSDISAATGILQTSPVNKNASMLQPLAIMLTGTNEADTKGGKTWIIGQSVPLTYSKFADKRAKGKLTK